MIFIILQKECKTEAEKDFLWYDPFFQVMKKIKGLGYTIKTKYSPYCVIHDKRVTVDEAVEVFKKYNKMDHLPKEVITRMMKDMDVVFYDYIQEPEVVRAENKNSSLNDSDFYKITKLLDDFSMEYSILMKTPQGIRIEIEEIKKEKYKKAMDDFLEELDRHYNYRID